MSQTVWVIRVYDCGETNIDGVYSSEAKAVERAKEIAEYAGLTQEEDNDCYYEDEYGQNASEVSEWDVL
jgi:hypothetical protein